MMKFVIIAIAFGILTGIHSCVEKSENIKISKSEALEIAKRYNLSGDSVQISFNSYTYGKATLGYKNGKRKLHYWEVSKNCNQCSIIQIDAETGKVFTEGKYKHIH